MRFWFALFSVGCSLEGFAGGGVPIGAGGQGGTAASGGSGGSCAACTCGSWMETKVSDSGPSMDPSLAFAADGWGVAWQDARDGNNEIYFARVDPIGMSAAELRVTNDAADTRLPNLVWNGARFAVAYDDTRSGKSAAYLAWIDASGSGVELELEVWGGDGAPGAPAVAWGGSSYLMVWEDFRSRSYELRKGVVTEAPTVENVDVPINSAAGNELAPVMVFGTFEYGLAWQDDRDGDVEIYFARLDGLGVKIGAESRVTTVMGESRGPSIAWTGSGYGLAWTDTRDGHDRVYFARLTEGGVKQDTELALGDGASPSVAWDGDGYAVAWQNGTQIHFARLDADGALLGTTAVVGTTGATSHPSLAWSGSAYAIAWQDDREGTSAIYFASCLP